MHVGIFADGGYEKGMGHVVRMKRLAEGLKQRCLITFYTNQDSEAFLHEEHWQVIVKPEPAAARIYSPGNKKQEA